MDELEYPSYIELLKLRKEHTIYEIAALTLGVDPRYLKLHPKYDEDKQCFYYDEDLSGYQWYISQKADQFEIAQYLDSEEGLLHLVPVDRIEQDLGIYSPSPKNELYKELKYSIIEAVKDKAVESIKPDAFDEAMWLPNTTESFKVKTESVKTWFTKHNFKTPFFEPPSTSGGLPDFLDKNHPEHPQELALAIEAWQRFSNLNISHPKEYMEKWLEETFYNNKQEAEKSVGTYVSKDARERIAMVANWRKTGGPKSKGLNQAVYNKALSKDLS